MIKNKRLLPWNEVWVVVGRGKERVRQQRWPEYISAWKLPRVNPFKITWRFNILGWTGAVLIRHDPSLRVRRWLGAAVRSLGRATHSSLRTYWQLMGMGEGSPDFFNDIAYALLPILLSNPDWTHLTKHTKYGKVGSGWEEEGINESRMQQKGNGEWIW